MFSLMFKNVIQKSEISISHLISCKRYVKKLSGVIAPSIRDRLTDDHQMKLQPIESSLKLQKEKIRQMKTDNASTDSIKKEVLIMEQYQQDLHELVSRLCPAFTVDREKMARLLSKRFYCHMSHSLYGGTAGLYDFGPLGSNILDNMLHEWHRHFVIKEQMLKVNCPIITPESVLKASGHVEKFADYMVKDTVTGECYRLDHLIKEDLRNRLDDPKVTTSDKEQLTSALSCIDEMELTELQSLMRRYDMKAPVTKNTLSEPEESNLMFSVNSSRREFLRPETAQSIFLNFMKLYEFNQRKLPFAVAQVGQAFRNEVNPRPGLLRGREFTMAEIEHFCYQNDKTHPKFSEIRDVHVTLYSAEQQRKEQRMNGWKVGEAVDKGLIANETLGYYIARIHQYLTGIGIHGDKIRFRQHLGNEMAHYASDCWDAECYTSYGWLECVGCADRSAHDLQCHSSATDTKMTVEKALEKPKTVQMLKPIINKKMLLTLFKKRKAKEIEDIILNLNQDILKELINDKKGEFKLPDTDIVIPKSVISEVKESCELLYFENVVPHVIEPSFGIGRLFYVLLEHNFKTRKEDEQRVYFSLRPKIAPIKVLVAPLSLRHSEQSAPFIRKITSMLEELQVIFRVDEGSGSIGRRYSRSDEMAIPYIVTIDFDTIVTQPHTVTLRERDSTVQVRVPVENVASVVHDLSTEKISWHDVTTSHSIFSQQSSDKEDLNNN